MKTLVRIAVAFAAGALVMYYLDPATGRRRRALARDRAVSAGCGASRAARATSKHAADRVRGMAARVRGRMSHEDIDDDRLEARVRSQLGRLVARPHGVEVRVRDGVVTLGGSAGAGEVAPLVDAIAAMPGVADVAYRLRTVPAPDTAARMHH